MIAYSRLIAICAVFLISAGVYLNSLHNVFVTDDIWQIVENERIRGFNYLPDVLFSSVWSASSAGYDSNYYRPVMYVLYMIAYKISALETWGYHSINILLHAINSVLALMTACLVFEKEPNEKIKDNESAIRLALLPAIAALVFGTNTINTEVVNWVASVPEISFTAFFLLSFYAYARGRLMLSSAAFLLSLLSKETAVVLLFFMFSYDIAIKKKKLWPAPPGFFKDYICHLPALAIYFGLRAYALGGVAPAKEQDPVLSAVQFLINLPALTVKYFWMTAVPTGLTFFNYMRFDAAQSISEPKAAASFVGAAAIVAALFLFRKKIPVIWMSLAWMAAPLLPVFALGWMLKFPVYENRYLYLSTVGYGVLVAFLVGVAVTRSRQAPVKLAAIGIAVFMVAAYSVGTVRQNLVWKDNYTLWKDTIDKDPGNPDAHIGLGFALSQMGMNDEAIKEYRAAIALNPAKPEAYSNLGVAYAKDGQDDEALSAFMKATEINPAYAQAYNNMGILYASNGELEKAVYEFKRALSIKPGNIEARKNLDRALELLENTRGAQP